MKPVGLTYFDVVEQYDSPMAFLGALGGWALVFVSATHCDRSVNKPCDLAHGAADLHVCMFTYSLNSKQDSACLQHLYRTM